MQSVLVVDEPARAAALLHPLRLAVLRELEQPSTCPEVAARLGETAQKVWYHVKRLERAGAVRRVASRRIGGIDEGRYQRAATDVWTSPRLLDDALHRRTEKRRTARRFLVDLAASLVEDAGALAASDEAGPTLAAEASVRLPRDAARRKAFLDDVRATLQALVERHAATAADEESDAFRMVLAVHPGRAAPRRRSAGGRR